MAHSLKGRRKTRSPWLKTESYLSSRTKPFILGSCRHASPLPHFKYLWSTKITFFPNLSFLPSKLYVLGLLPSKPTVLGLLWWESRPEINPISVFSPCLWLFFLMVPSPNQGSRGIWSHFHPLASGIQISCAGLIQRTACVLHVLNHVDMLWWAKTITNPLFLHK